MLGCVGVLAATLGWAPADGVEPEPPTDVSVPGAELTIIVLDSEGMDADALTAALQLRLTGRTFLDVHDPRPDDGVAYVHVDRVPPATIRLTLVESSGRAYDRTLDHEPDQAVRVAAATLATLITSIEAGGVTPDRHDAAIPEPAAVEPEPEPEPAPPEPELPKTDPPDAPPAPVGWLGISGAGLVVLGAVPTTTAGPFGGGGAAVRGAYRSARGAMAVVDVRATHREHRGLDGTRLRIAAGGGWAFRWGRFELPIAGEVSVEPWWVRRTGSVIELDIAGAPAQRRPLLGLQLGLEPGWRFMLPHGYDLRVGPRLGVGGSFVPEGGARTARIDVVLPGQAPQPALRLGGLELELGASITLWIPVLGGAKKAGQGA